MALFKEGDTVRLKSGGPTMTVEKYQKGGGAACVWFDNNKEQKRSVFNEKTLDKVDMKEEGDIRVGVI